MGRMFIQSVGIILLILFGVQIGVYQAEKRQDAVAQSDVDMNMNQPAHTQSAEISVNGRNNGSVIRETNVGNNVKGLDYTGSNLTGTTGTIGATGTTGTTCSTLADAAGYEGEERVAESFLNRLGNKLGELLRMLVSSLIGWFSSLLKSIIN